jgi:hypothetical protein
MEAMCNIAMSPMSETAAVCRGAVKAARPRPAEAMSAAAEAMSATAEAMSATAETMSAAAETVSPATAAPPATTAVSTAATASCLNIRLRIQLAHPGNRRFRR